MIYSIYFTLFYLSSQQYFGIACLVKNSILINNFLILTTIIKKTSFLKVQFNNIAKKYKILLENAKTL